MEEFQKWHHWICLRLVIIHILSNLFHLLCNTIYLPFHLAFIKLTSLALSIPSMIQETMCIVTSTEVCEGTTSSFNDT